MVKDGFEMKATSKVEEKVNVLKANMDNSYKFIKLFGGQKVVLQIAWPTLMLNRNSLMPMKEKESLDHRRNLDPGLIFFLNTFYWQIAQQFAVQDQVRSPFLADSELTLFRLR